MISANRVILRALKKYGLILADNGSPWFLSGVPDPRWDNDDLRDLLDGFGGHLRDAGLLHVSEVFDGDPPHAPGGCFAQAWSTAELLRAYALLEDKKP